MIRHAGGDKQAMWLHGGSAVQLGALTFSNRKQREDRKWGWDVKPQGTAPTSSSRAPPPTGSVALQNCFNS